jgi:hypothetical protein
MKTEYRNRYGDLITFEKKDNIIEMAGIGEHYRLGGWPGEVGMPTERFSMIDPSGGPYITAQAEWHGEETSGTDMGLFLPEWDGLKIEYITVEEGVAKLHLCH